MKVSITVSGSLMQRTTGSAGRAETLPSRIRRRVTTDLQRELQSVIQSERTDDTDPETRRDALERAVRRIWGATL